MSTIEIPATQAVHANVSTIDEITLTPAALQHLKDWIAKQGGGIGLRFGVKKSGCSGMSYVVDLVKPDEIPLEATHHRFKLDERLVLIVDQESYPYLKGTIVDYVRDGLNRSFKFINPNEKNSCGCGESFYI